MSSQNFHPSFKRLSVLRGDTESVHLLFYRAALQIVQGEVCVSPKFLFPKLNNSGSFSQRPPALRSSLLVATHLGILSSLRISFMKRWIRSEHQFGCGLSAGHTEGWDDHVLRLCKRSWGSQVCGSCFVLLFGRTAQHAGPQFPDQGSNPLQWKLRVLTTGPQASPPSCVFNSNVTSSARAQTPLIPLFTLLSSPAPSILHLNTAQLFTFQAGKDEKRAAVLWYTELALNTVDGTEHW